MEPFTLTCRDCDWEQQMPTRPTAEHAKRVHEVENGHDVAMTAED